MCNMMLTSPQLAGILLNSILEERYVSMYNKNDKTTLY